MSLWRLIVTPTRRGYKPPERSRRPELLPAVHGVCWARKFRSSRGYFGRSCQRSEASQDFNFEAVQIGPGSRRVRSQQRSGKSSVKHKSRSRTRMWQALVIGDRSP